MTSGPLLEGRVCVVSGAGPGLGRATAMALAAHGADVVLVARRRDPLHELAEEVARLGTRVLPVTADITSEDDCENLAKAVAAELGGVDAVCNNAVRFDVFQPFAEVDLSAWGQILDTNLFGTLKVTRALLPSMRCRGGGSVVMVGSMVFWKPFPLEGGYAVSKGALVTATRVLASELGGEGIRVNAVVPGWMWSPAVRLYVRSTAEQRGVAPEEVREEIASRTALGRIPSLEEVASAIVFLASPLSSAVTGQTLDVNGGEVFA